MPQQAGSKRIPSVQEILRHKAELFNTLKQVAAAGGDVTGKQIDPMAFVAFSSVLAQWEIALQLALHNRAQESTLREDFVVKDSDFPPSAGKIVA